MKPRGTSTPSLVPYIKGRNPIGSDSTMCSPIKSRITPDDSKNDQVNDTENINNSMESSDEDTSPSHHGNDTDSDDEPKITTESPKRFTNCSQKQYSNKDIPPEQKINNWKDPPRNKSLERKAKQQTTLNIHHFVCAISVLIFGAFIYNQYSLRPITIDVLKKSFPQGEKFWKSIETSVSEIKTFEKPSVIVLVYKGNMPDMTELLSNITIYASCILNDNCHVDPILINGRDLNTFEIIEDYGIIIKRYRALLEEKRIMVVEHLDDILGSVAQAFHYICDEYTPLVKKSLILFTMRVDKYEGRELEQVVNILEKKWSDIGRDKLEALIARVSSIVLRIK